MKISAYVFYGLMLILPACEQAVQVRVPLPDSEAEPVIMCFASATQPTIAYIGKTIPLSAKMPDTSSLHVLSVQIVSETGQILGILSPSGDEGLFSSVNPLNFEPDTAYFIRVQTIEFGVTESDFARLPEPVQMDSVRPNPLLNSFGYVYVNCYFRDIAAGQDYYTTGGQFYSNGIEVRQNKEQRLIPPNVFTDSKFDLSGGVLPLEIPRSASVDGVGIRLPVDSSHIIVYHFSPDLGRFISSIHQNEGTFYDVLVEPVPVISNIKYGQGIFGLFQSDTVVYIP